MATAEQIRNRLEEMAKGHGPAVSNIAKVKSVNEDEGICVLVDEDNQEIFNVRLRPVISNNKSFILVPKVGSYVLAVRIEDDDDWMIIAADEITKVGYYVGNTIFEIDATGYLIKKENETLKKMMVDLLSAIENMSFTLTTPDTINGSTTLLNNKTEFTAIKTRFNEFLN